MEIRLPHNPTYDFGIGVDRLSGSAMNKVVKGEISGVQFAPGSIQSFTVSRVNTNRELQNQLGIDVNASYGCASFGAGVEARFSYMKESKIQSTSLFMTVTATIRYEDLSIDEPYLTDNASEWVDRPDIFAQRYGDMFIRASKRGGLFIGILRVETSSEEAASEIEGELKGTYGLFEAEAKAKWKEVINSHNVSVYCSIYSEGGPAIHIRNPHDPEELLELANYWMKEMNERPNQYARIYEWILSPITIAEGPLPPNSDNLEHAQNVLKFCSRERAELLDQLNLFDWIVSHPERFDWTNSVSRDEVREAYINTQIDLDTIADCASAAINHPSQAVMPATYASAHGGVFPKAIVPSPLPIPKPTSSEIPLIRVPNMIGVYADDLDFASHCLSAGTVDACVAGTVFTDMNGNPAPMHISREFAEFLLLAWSGQVVIKFVPDWNEIGGGTAYVSDAQDPPPGTLVPIGREVTLHFKCGGEPQQC